MILQVFPECHSLCIWLIALGSGAGARCEPSLVPSLPSLPELGMVASCCHLLFDRLAVEPHPSDSEHLDL